MNRQTNITYPQSIENTNCQNGQFRNTNSIPEPSFINPTNRTINRIKPEWLFQNSLLLFTETRAQQAPE